MATAKVMAGEPSDQEMADLHRKQRMIQGSRKQLTDDTKAAIRRQRTTIEKLQADNAALKKELSHLLQAAFRGPSPQLQESIDKLQSEVDHYTRKIETEKITAEDLEYQLEMLSEKLLEKRKGMGGINAPRENNYLVSKQIKVLENRLDKALVKFNEALAQNKRLRDTIENLRRERVVFDQIYKKLERELQHKKKEITGIVEISNIAYEARDQAQTEMSALRAQADREQSAFEAEWIELGKTLEKGVADRQEALMLTQKLIKTQKLANRTVRSTQPRPKAPAPEEPQQSVKVAVEKRKSVSQAAWGWDNKIVPSDLPVADQVASYEEAFAKIQEATGITDTEELVTAFINVEDQNFSLFNFVNEMNQEIEKLEEQAGELKTELVRHENGQEDSGDTQRLSLVRDLEEKAQLMEAKAKMYEIRHAGAISTTSALKEAIQSIFVSIGCEITTVRELVGDSGVTETNMMLYLGLIEQRINEILQAYMQYEAAAVGKVSSNEGPATPAGGHLVAIEAPTTNDEYFSDDESEDELEDRPLTKEELQQKTLKHINRSNRRRVRRVKS